MNNGSPHKPPQRTWTPPPAPKPPFELPWVECDIRMHYPWTPAINWARFLEAVHECGGFERLGEQERWKRLLAMAAKPRGWLGPTRQPLGQQATWPLRDAVDRQRSRLGYAPGAPAYFEQGRSLVLRAFIRYRRRPGVHEQPEQDSAFGVLAFLRGGLQRGVWQTADQVRHLDIRAQRGRANQAGDLLLIRVEECHPQEWPEWTMTEGIELEDRAGWES